MIDYVLSFGTDPGGKRIDKATGRPLPSVGWGLVKVFATPGRRPEYVDSGREVYGAINSRWLSAKRMSYGGLHIPFVASVEWPSPGRQQAVVAVAETLAEAASIARSYEELGLPGYRIPPFEWRKGVVGRCKRTKTESIDKITERALTLIVVGIPPDLNCHKRDGLGVAIAGGRRYWQDKRMPITLMGGGNRKP